MNERMNAYDAGPAPDLAAEPQEGHAAGPSEDSLANAVIDVFVAHRSRLLADGIAAIVAQQAGFRLVGTATEEATILAEAARLASCVVVLDCLLVGEQPALLRTLVADESRRVVLITARPDDRRILEAVRLGVRGVLLESMGARLLTTCIRKVAAGEEWIEQGSAGRLLRQYARQTSSSETLPLSRREIEIVRRFARDLSNREIAGELCISTATVKSHVHSIFRKLGVATRAEVVARVRSLGVA